MSRAYVWTGTEWKVVVPKRWSGTVWVDKPVQVWTGSAWATSALQTLQTGLSLSASAACPIVFTGSSTTFGNNATNSDKRFVNQLTASLQKQYPSGLGTETSVPHSTSATFTNRTFAGVHGYNAGRGATTSADYLTATHRTNIAALNPKAIFHMIGANDYGTNVDPATFKANLAASVADLKTKLTQPCVQVLVRGHQRQDVTGTFPWSAYGNAMFEIAAADPSNVVYIDLNAEFVAVGIPGADPSNYLDADNLHLTDAGHSYLADKLWSVLVGGTRPAAPIVYGATVLSDTFTRANSTTSAGVATTGQTWTTESGVWGINTNQLYAPTAPGNVIINSGVTNFYIASNFTFTNNGGMLFRHADASNRWGLFLDLTQRRVQLYKVSGGINVVIQETGDNVVTGSTTYLLEVVVFGDLIIGYVDGIEYIRYTMTEAEFAASQARTNVGFRQTVASTGMRWDNLVVKTLTR